MKPTLRVGDIVSSPNVGVRGGNTFLVATDRAFPQRVTGGGKSWQTAEHGDLYGDWVPNEEPIVGHVADWVADGLRALHQNDGGLAVTAEKRWFLPGAVWAASNPRYGHVAIGNGEMFNVFWAKASAGDAPVRVGHRFDEACDELLRTQPTRVYVGNINDLISGLQALHSGLSFVSAEPRPDVFATVDEWL